MFFSAFVGLRASVQGNSRLTLDSSLGTSGHTQQDLVSPLVPPVLNSEPLCGISAPLDLKILGLGPFRGLFCLNTPIKRRFVSTLMYVPVGVGVLLTERLL